MKTEFKMGDRVATYSAKHGRKTGTVGAVSGGYEMEGISGLVGLIGVEGDDGAFYRAHPMQCRKLKPRGKSVRITRKMLAETWDRVVTSNYEYDAAKFSVAFKKLADALGLDDET